MKKAYALALIFALAPSAPPCRAADHGDAPLASRDLSIDIGDVYFFLDPGDNSKVVLAMDTHGFIVPSENSNLSPFDRDAAYRLMIENTGDAVADKYFEIMFSRQASPASPQTARISMGIGTDQPALLFTAPTTLASSTASMPPPPVVTTDATTGISFFAGLTDDPFFFDVPAELRYRASRIGGMPDPTLLERGRDSFAGYNTQMIVLSVPATMLRGAESNSMIGLSAATLRRAATYRFPNRTFSVGSLVQSDRMGIPIVNTLFIPFSRKDEYNRSTPADDAAGRFSGDIMAALTALGTDAAHIPMIIDLAVTRGDMLRLDLSIANTGPQGGNNAGGGFPNGRRPVDDTIDTIVTIVNNQTSLGDSVDANDVMFRDTFPFFGPPHQPFPPGTVDDLTRN